MPCATVHRSWTCLGRWAGCNASSRTMKDGGRQMVDILTAAQSDGLIEVEAACAEALAAGTCSADVILNILARRSDPAPASTIATPERLQLQVLPLRRLRSLRRVATTARSPRRLCGRDGGGPWIALRSCR